MATTLRILLLTALLLVAPFARAQYTVTINYVMHESTLEVIPVGNGSFTFQLLGSPFVYNGGLSFVWTPAQFSSSPALAITGDSFSSDPAGGYGGVVTSRTISLSVSYTGSSGQEPGSQLSGGLNVSFATQPTDFPNGLPSNQLTAQNWASGSSGFYGWSYSIGGVDDYVELGHAYGNITSLMISEIPEPSASAAMVGLAGLALVTWRRRQQSARG